MGDAAAVKCEPDAFFPILNDRDDFIASEALFSADQAAAGRLTDAEALDTRNKDSTAVINGEPRALQDAQIPRGRHGSEAFAARYQSQ